MATSIADIRKKYPQYNDLSDQALADALHQKFYSDLPKEDFYSKIGIQPSQPAIDPALQKALDTVRPDPNADRSFGSALQYGADQFTENSASALNAVGDMLGGRDMVRKASQTMPGIAGPVVGLLFGGPAEDGLRGVVDAPENYAPAGADVRWNDPSTWGYIPRAVVESAPEMAATVATGGAGKLAMAAPSFISTFGRTVDAIEKENGTQATWGDYLAAIGGSAAISQLERLGLEGILSAPAKSVVGRVLGASAGEGATEALQSGVEQIASTATTEGGPRLDINQALNEGVVGAGAGGSIRSGIETPSAISRAMTDTGVDVAEPQAAAAARLAERIRRTEGAIGADARNIDPTSPEGARQILDNVHRQQAEEIKALAADLREGLSPRYAADFDDTIRRATMMAAERGGKNKVKDVVSPEDIALVREAVGGTQQGEALAQLLEESSLRSALHRGGLAGGLSRIVQRLGIGKRGNYTPGIDNPLGIAGIGLALSGEPALLAGTIAADATARGIDALTGRRSRVDRFARTNANPDLVAASENARSSLPDVRADAIAEAERRAAEAEAARAAAEAEDARSRKQRRAADAVGINGVDRMIYDATGLRPSAVDEGLRILETEGHVRPNDVRAFRDRPQDLMRDENGQPSNRGNRMFDLLDMLAEQGRIARDPNWGQRPPAPQNGSGVDDPYRMARYEAGAARNVEANLAAKDRVEQAGLDPTSTTLIAAAVDSIGAVNNRRDAEAIVDRTLAAVRESGDTRAEAIASSELRPLLENFRHATPEAAAMNKANIRGSNEAPQQAQASRTPGLVEQQRLQREEQRKKQEAYGDPARPRVSSPDVQDAGTESPLGADRSGTNANDQRGDQGGSIERPPVNSDGTVTLDHFTDEEFLRVTDPSKWGKSGAAVLSRGERNRIGLAPGRTYFGIATGKPGGYINEFKGSKRKRMTTRFPADGLYDLAADPDNLQAIVEATPQDKYGPYQYAGRSLDRTSLLETLVRDNGHAGFWVKDPKLGLVAAVFNPVHVGEYNARREDMVPQKHQWWLGAAHANRIARPPAPQAIKDADEYRAANPDRTMPALDGALDIDVDYLKTLADWMDSAKHEPTRPEVAKSYKALADETLAQYEQILKGGLEVDAWDGKGEPYVHSGEMLDDVTKNNHLWFFRTDNGFGSIEDANTGDHPMMAKTKYKDSKGRTLLVNDVFRIVHDYFGHGQNALQFGPKGEYNAFQEHARMFSPEAIPALAAETLAQNAWVNFGPHMRDAEGNLLKEGDPGWLPAKDRPFTDQTATVVPWELLQEDKNPEAIGNAIFKKTNKGPERGLSSETPVPQGGGSPLEEVTTKRDKTRIKRVLSRKPSQDTEEARQERRKKGGWLVKAYHGTSGRGIIDSFSDNLSGDSGGAYGGAQDGVHYFTSSTYDVSRNYAAPNGPDMGLRLERIEDGIQDDLESRSDSVRLGAEDELFAILEEWQPGEHDPDYGLPSGYVKSLVEEAAKRRLGVENEGLVMPVYLRIKNPVVVSYGPGKDTKFTTRRQAEKLREAILDAAVGYDSSYDVVETADALHDSILYEGYVSSTEVEEKLRSLGLTDDETGDYVGGRVIADVWRKMGFDAVDLNAAKRFPGMAGTGDATHYMILGDGSQVRSQNAKFKLGKHRRSKDILAGAAGLVAAPLASAIALALADAQDDDEDKKKGGETA